MCTTNIYTTVYPDGRKETSAIPTLCSHARHGAPCPNNVIFQHPTKYVSAAGKASSAPASSPFLAAGAGGHFPPSPAYTPRSGTPNNYRSGDESDKSAGYHSSSSRGRRSSGLYIHGQNVYQLDPYSAASPSSSSSRRRGERVVVTNGPPSPRTPPTGFAAPPAGSSPSSPTSPFVVDVNPRRGSSSSRSKPVVIENSRPLSGIEVVDPRDYRTSSSRHHSSHRPSSKHNRHASTSSYESPSSSRRQQQREDEEAAEARRHRRERRQEELANAERLHAQRSVKYNDRIAAANANIANRPARPRSGAYRDADVTEGLKNLNLDPSTANGLRRQRSDQEMEDEAMKQRLKDRMMPRRATVSGRPARHQVRYDDGTVRWE